MAGRRGPLQERLKLLGSQAGLAEDAGENLGRDGLAAMYRHGDSAAPIGTAQLSVACRLSG